MRVGEYFYYSIPLCISFVLPFFLSLSEGTTNDLDSLEHDLIPKSEIDKLFKLVKILVYVGLMAGLVSAFPSNSNCWSFASTG